MTRMLHALALAFVLLLVAQGTAMSGTASLINPLQCMIGQDHFAAETTGMYLGVSDPTLRAELNAKVDAAALALGTAAARNPAPASLLVVFKEHLDGIDRYALETEDAERVASIFERMLDLLGMESSEGILNNWMYGFDPNEA